MDINQNNQKIQKIKSALLSSKNLFVSSLVYGEKYTGKKTIIKELFNDFIWVDGSDFKKLQQTLKENNFIVITNFEKINNLDSLNFENKNIVAIYNKINLNENLEKKFAFFYHIPSLSQRDDLKSIIEYFLNEAKKVFEIDEEIVLKKEDLDLTQNFKSLKKSIYKLVLYNNISKNELDSILYRYFLNNFDGINLYKDFLKIFEKPLIQAGLKIYKSQLKLSEILGINRNTLRKKINEYFKDRL